MNRSSVQFRPAAPFHNQWVTKDFSLMGKSKWSLNCLYSKHLHRLCWPLESPLIISVSNNFSVLRYLGVELQLQPFPQQCIQCCPVLRGDLSRPLRPHFGQTVQYRTNIFVHGCILVDSEKITLHPTERVFLWHRAFSLL